MQPPTQATRWLKQQSSVNLRSLVKRSISYPNTTRPFQGVFDAATYLASRSGPLLDKLRDANYFSRFFIDTGALCWPNGLEISPAKVHELANLHAAA